MSEPWWMSTVRALLAFLGLLSARVYFTTTGASMHVAAGVFAAAVGGLFTSVAGSRR